MSLVTQITSAFAAIGADVRSIFTRLTSAENKLDGIEAGATADQTPAEIKTAYEGNANTNAFTDTHKTKVDRLTVSSAVNIDDLVATVAGIGDSVTLRGEYDVTGKSVFPSGAKKGYSYIVKGTATIGGYELNEGDRLISLKTTASTTLAADWFHADGSDKVASVNGRTGAVSGLQEASAVGDTNRNFTTDYTTARDA